MTNPYGYYDVNQPLSPTNYPVYGPGNPHPGDMTDYSYLNSSVNPEDWVGHYRDSLGGWESNINRIVDEGWVPGSGMTQDIFNAIDNEDLNRYFPGQGDPDIRSVWEDVNSPNDPFFGDDPVMSTGDVGGGEVGGDTETTRSVSQPWEPTQPYILGSEGRAGILPEAERLYRSGGPQYYGGDTVANLNPLQKGALKQYASQPGRNYDLTAQGMDTIGRTARGDYLGGDQFMSAYGDDILENINSRFGTGGRTGSAYQADAAAKEMGGVASRLYDSERNRQQGAALASPGMQGQYYDMQTGDTDALMNAGYILQGQNQSEIDAAKNRWDYNQNLPQQNLRNYQGFVNPIATGTPATTDVSSPLYQPNKYQGMLGGAMTGASAGSMFGPWGALVGGVAGGYLGSRS